MFLFLVIFYQPALCQVGINTTEPTKTVDVNGEIRIRNLPVGESGDQILSSDPEGNIRKVSRKDISGASSSTVDETTLGYKVQPWESRPQPPISPPSGGTATELGCKKWSGNNHTYCAYTVSQGINWYNAFIFSRSMGGYLVTMPSHAERIWVHSEMVSDNSGYHLGGNIWIGLHKIVRPGNPLIFQWITGEKFVIDWSTNPARAEHWFNTGEPNDAGGNEGAGHLMSSVERKWNDLNPTTTSGFTHLLIEFND